MAGKGKKKKPVATKRGCGCTGKTLYVVLRTGGGQKLIATNCKGKAKKLKRLCLKRAVKKGVKRYVCDVHTVKMPRPANMLGKKGKKKRGKKR